MLVSESVLADFPYGVQRLYRFENGFGASVVRNEISYGGNSGLWELAVIKWDNLDWDICYDTDITDNFVGWLTELEIRELLDRIEAL